MSRSDNVGLCSLPPIPRFWAQVAKTDYCWNWIGSLDTDGYGGIKVDGRRISDHRFSYALAFGNIPDGMSVLHKCDNPRCVNPCHLFLGTQLDNVADMIRKGRDRKAIGEDAPRAKLTNEDVEQVRERYKARDKVNGARALAIEFGVRRTAIERIIHGKTWRHSLENSERQLTESSDPFGDA